MLFNSHSSAIQYKMPVGVKHSNLLTDQRGKHHSLLEVCLPEQGGANKMHDSGPSRCGTFGHSQNITNTRLMITAPPTTTRFLLQPATASAAIICFYRNNINVKNETAYVHV